MSGRDIFADIAAIENPMPGRPDYDDDAPEDVQDDWYQEECAQVLQARLHDAEHLRLAAEEGDIDPLLASLTVARRAKEHAERQIRQLVAYGREFIQPRPYTLGDLAAAAGMSVSGVRTAYDHHDVDAVTEATGARPREWRAPDPDPRPAETKKPGPGSPV